MHWCDILRHRNQMSMACTKIHRHRSGPAGMRKQYLMALIVYIRLMRRKNLFHMVLL
jgi:hypothetical protein